MNEKTYIVADKEELQILFPDLDWNHQRLSFDGSQAVIGVIMTQGEVDDYEEENPSHLVLDHAGAISFLDAEDKIGVWRTEDPVDVLSPVTGPDPGPDPDLGGDEL